MKISIVTTLYCSAPYLLEFYRRIKKAVADISDDYEIVFVNDGSPDNSLEILLSIYKKDDKIKIIDLSRNFGHHKAIMTGLAHALGELVFLIDSDLEEEPEQLKVFYEEMNNAQHIDVVYGVQKERSGGLLRRVAGSWAYTLFNYSSDYQIPKNIMTIRLMTRRYLDSLLSYKEKEPIFAVLCSMIGFRQKAIELIRPYKGRTTYSIPKRFNLVANGFFAFCNRSFIYSLFAGIIISGGSLSYIFWLLFKGLLFVDIRTATLVSIWFLIGLIMTVYAMIGLFLFRIFNEVKERPMTVVRKIYSKQQFASPIKNYEERIL